MQASPLDGNRVCQVLEFSRSTIYAVRARASANVAPMVRDKRGPKPKMPNVDLLKAIRDESGGFALHRRGASQGLGALAHGARHQVFRTRVLQLMREHSLLSPHRQAPGEPNLHDGRITTDCPNEMWGTDGERIATVDEGMVWIFSTVDHCDGMCTGIHAAKIGDRFAALEPISQGLLGGFGSVAAEVGRGLSLRMDHGSQCTSDDFREQIKFRGIAARYVFVAERFNRTLKEQAIHGHVSKTWWRFVPPLLHSRIDTIATGVSKNWASSHRSKPVRSG
jgi:putative transposase